MSQSVVTGRAGGMGMGLMQPGAQPPNLPRTSTSLLSAISVGLVAGLDVAIFSIALAGVLFSGPLSGGLPIAVMSALFGTIVFTTSALVFGRLRGDLPHVQDIGVAVLAPALASGVAVLNAPDETRIATAMVIIAVTTVATGLLIWLTGQLRLGRITRYIPQPVLAGFLAGTGLLLVTSGVAVTAGLPTDQLMSVAQWRDAALWPLAAAVAVALSLSGLLRVWSHPAALLLLLGLATLACHAARVFRGQSVQQSEAAGWLVSIPHQATKPSIADLWAAVDWAQVAGSWQVVLTVAVLCLVASALNQSALDAVVGDGVDVDAELRQTGLANMLAGAFGSAPGYTGLANSLIAFKMAGGHKGVSLVVIAVLMLGFVGSDALVSAIPRFVASGLIIFFGLDLLGTWLFSTRARYLTSEWAIVLLIVVLFGWVGAGVAVLVGLLVSAGLFVWTIARAPVVRRVRTLAGVQSSLERNPAEQAALLEMNDRVAVIELEGHLFFGTADKIQSSVAARLAPPDGAALRVVVLDFGNVLGLDSSTATRLARIAALTRQHGVTLMLSRLGDRLEQKIQRYEPRLLGSPGVQVFASLDQAVQRIEDDLLVSSADAVTLHQMAMLHAATPADAPLIEHFLSGLTAEHLPAGQVVLRQGDVADGLVLLEQGQVSVMRRAGGDTTARVRGMAAGAILGDIATATGAARSATVIAETDVTLRRVPMSLMVELEQTNPPLAMAIQRMVMRALALKVLTANRLNDGGLG
jgi:sulfate permease, SulP family